MRPRTSTTPVEAVPRGAGHVLRRARRREHQARRGVRANAEVKRAPAREGRGAACRSPTRRPPSTRSATSPPSGTPPARCRASDIKDLEGRFKRVEQTIRGAEDDRWRRTNPEAQARAAATVAQLEATPRVAASRPRQGRGRGQRRRPPLTRAPPSRPASRGLTRPARRSPSSAASPDAVTLYARAVAVRAGGQVCAAWVLRWLALTVRAVRRFPCPG